MSNAPLWQRVLQAQLPAVLIALGATLGVMGLRGSTLLESWELGAYDQMLRSQPAQMADSPILLVTVTEADIQAQKTWPLPDPILIQALTKLQAADPKVIGLDLFRDLPIPDPFNPGAENTTSNNLSQYLIAHPDVIAVCKVGRKDNPGVAPPAGLQPEQVGFADLPLDPDGVIRRGILIRTPTPDNACSPATSLGLALALHYLDDNSEFDANEQLKIGEQVFARVAPNTGGYQGIDARGYQILLNFQNPSLFQSVTLTELLEGKVSPAQIRNRVVLLGVTADSSNDKFMTPLNDIRAGEERTPGLVIHAQIAQQILGAVNRTQPLIWTWDGLGEWAWVYGWSLLAGVLWLNLARQSLLRSSLGLGIGLGALLGVSYGVFVVAAGWLPLIPAGLGMTITTFALLVYGGTRADKSIAIATTPNQATIQPPPPTPSQSLESQSPATVLDFTPPLPSLPAYGPGLDFQATVIFAHQPPESTTEPSFAAFPEPGQSEIGFKPIQTPELAPDEATREQTKEQTYALDVPADSLSPSTVPTSRPGVFNDETFVLMDEETSPPRPLTTPPTESDSQPTVIYAPPPQTIVPQVLSGDATVVDPDHDSPLAADTLAIDISGLHPEHLGLNSTEQEPGTDAMHHSGVEETFEAHSYSAALIPGLLAGRYQILTQLGQGGFGRTYLAEDTQMPLKPVCVVKQLLPSRSDAKSMQVARRLFQREAATLAQVGQHDRIPRLLAYFEESQAFFLVQEYVQGRSLQDELREKPVFSPRYVKQLLEEILTILVYVHSLNVIHRDIKPGNILRRESDQQLVLIDFGAVRHIQPEDLAAVDQKFTIAIGTRGYAPSEQMAGYPTFASDIYALGAVAIQALSGVSPSNIQHDCNSGELIWFSATPISEKFQQILNRMVRYNFRQRYQSAQAVLEDLAQTAVD